MHPDDAAGVPEAHEPLGSISCVNSFVKGLRYAAIARELFLSQATVRSHVDAMKARFGVSTIVTLVLAAVVAGLISTEAWPVQLTGLSEFDPLDSNR